MRYNKKVALFSVSLVIIGYLTYAVTRFAFPGGSKDANIEAYLVLDGNIQREILAAQIAKARPEIPIIISKGSMNPCVYKIFKRDSAPMHNVFLERCSDSTIQNYLYGSSLLAKLSVSHRVGVITSASQNPRATLLAKIILGSLGLSSEIIEAKEIGIPGNTENPIKTFLQATAMILSAPLMNRLQTACPHIIKLDEVDMQKAETDGYKCEASAGLKLNEQ